MTFDRFLNLFNSLSRDYCAGHDVVIAAAYCTLTETHRIHWNDVNTLNAANSIVWC